jgi:hypothetical protein
MEVKFKYMKIAVISVEALEVFLLLLIFFLQIKIRNLGNASIFCRLWFQTLQSGTVVLHVYVSELMITPLRGYATHSQSRHMTSKPFYPWFLGCLWRWGAFRRQGVGLALDCIVCGVHHHEVHWVPCHVVSMLLSKNLGTIGNSV